MSAAYPALCLRLGSRARGLVLLLPRERAVHELYVPLAPCGRSQGHHRSWMILKSTKVKFNPLRTRGAVVVDGNIDKRQPHVDGRAAYLQMSIRDGRRVHCTTRRRHDPRI